VQVEVKRQVVEGRCNRRQADVYVDAADLWA
jgi:hypothetical protein